MIKKINFIRNFGVFHNFSWGNLQEFAPKNLIYGWNYSGKTTLSRLFACIEVGKFNTDYTGGYFEILLDDNNTVDSNLLSSTNLPIVKVFNDDFVQKNLKWNGGMLNPILLLGENSIEKSTLIEGNKLKIEEFKIKQASASKESNDAENMFETELTSTASNIKDLLRLGNYTKIHVKQVIQDVIKQIDLYFLTNFDQIELLKITATSDDKLDNIPKFVIADNLSNVIGKVEQILQRVPSISVTINELEQDSNLSSWVEKGLVLHSESGTCKFCNSRLEESRLTQLNQYFSKDYKDLMHEIQIIKDQVIKCKINLALPDEVRFYKELRTKYAELRIKTLESIEALNKSIGDLILVLDKKAINAFDKFSTSEMNFAFQLDKNIDSLNEIVLSHNQKCDAFENDKQLAITKLQKYYIARYIKEQDYLYKFKKVRVMNALSERYKKLVASLTLVNKKLESEISSIHKGQENINKYIHGFLGREDLFIDVEKIQDIDSFVLKRNNEKAKNLSEGEKTAIAFSYFLTNLESIRLSDAIVFIDDPISSLDSNHIYHVYSLIANVIFEEKTLKCKQLFISTHNFEFYSLLKDSKQLEIKAKGTGKYLIRRDNTNKSSIKELPKQLQNFKSEYQYLFKVLDDFRKESDKESYPLLFVLPNIIRKFLESYTSTRIPNSSGLEERVKELFDNDIYSKEILKFIHTHNHFNGVMQQSRHDDTINLCEPTIDYILNWLETNDNLHYLSLCNANN